MLDTQIKIEMISLDPLGLRPHIFLRLFSAHLLADLAQKLK